MDVTIVSNDEELTKLCGGILSDIAREQSVPISALSSDAFDREANLYIWDFDPSLRPPPKINPVASLVVLAYSRDVPAVRAALGPETTLILKPVTRAIVSALLSVAVLNHDDLVQGLLQANLKLQEYDQKRTDFLARVVHDFRAPLTALTGYCGLLLGEPLGSLNDAQKEVVERMHQSVRRLSRLADGMLQMSVARHVKKRPDRQRADLKSCLEEALNEIGPAAREKRVVIKSDLEACGDHLYFGPDQITQVLVNILDNSCKFAPKNGRIVIRGYQWFWERRHSQSVVSILKERRRDITVQPNSYRVDVRDSGNPIPEEHLLSIFDEYVSYSGARERGGAGLGLAICRGIIDQHSGRMWAENTIEGPMFSFVLPMQPKAPVEVNLGLIHSLEAEGNASHEHM